MKLKPGDQITVEFTPDELLDADAYLLLDKELFKAQKVSNIIAQSIWGRLLEKMPEKAKRHDLLAISVNWIPSENLFSVTFWNSTPPKDAVIR